MTLKYASKWKLLVFAAFAAAKALGGIYRLCLPGIH